MHILLPTHPTSSSFDPLSVFNEENPSAAQVLYKLLNNALQELDVRGVVLLPTLIEDMAYSIYNKGSLDTRNLRDYINKEPCPISPSAVRSCLTAALQLSEVFPSNTLMPLTENGVIVDAAVMSVTCSGAQINALLAHQVLGTLSEPLGTTWGPPDFTSWYNANPAHQNAVDGYLETIFHHFESGGYDPDATFTFRLQTADDMPDPTHCSELPDIHLKFVESESEPSDTTSTPFVLTAANSQPGPGPSGTQEERLQSTSPALSASALFTPIIPPNTAVITSPFPVHAAWNGHNQTARLSNLFLMNATPHRSYILADALPIDEMEDDISIELIDLHPQNIHREVRKLYAAFSGAAAMHREQNLESPCTIEAGAWGCGAFGGNVGVKVVCMMIAAGLAGVRVEFFMVEGRGVDGEAVRRIVERGLRVRGLWEGVLDEGIRGCGDAGGVAEFLCR